MVICRQLVANEFLKTRLPIVGEGIAGFVVIMMIFNLIFYFKNGIHDE